MSAVLVLTGRLTRREPVEGLRVLVTHRGSKNPRWTARVGRDGRFSVTADDLAELRTSTDDSVPLIVQVLNGGHVLARTRVNVPVPAKVHLTVPERDGIWAGGSVRTSRGRPAPGTDSAVSRVLLDGQRVLARARTDEEGRWETLVEKPGEWLDLKVGVVDGGSEIVTGLVHCELRSELVEDLTVPDDRVLARGQLDQLSGRFTSVLAADPVHLDDAGVDVAAGRLEGPVEVVQGLRENGRWQAAGAPAGAALALADTGELDPVSVLSRSDRDLAHQLEAAVESSHIAGLARPLSEAASALRRTAAELALTGPWPSASLRSKPGVSADPTVRSQGKFLRERGRAGPDAAGDHSALFSGAR